MRDHGLRIIVILQWRIGSREIIIVISDDVVEILCIGVSATKPCIVGYGVCGIVKDIGKRKNRLVEIGNIQL
jgi:hypothetical protein